MGMNDVIDRLEAGIYMYMTAKHIHVDAFHLFFTYPFHLYVYAFPEACRRFCHTSQTRAASQDSIVLLPILPLLSAPFRTLRYGEQGCQKRTAAEGAEAAY